MYHWNIYCTALCYILLNYAHLNEKKNHCKKGYALIKNKLMQNKSLQNLNNTNNALIHFFFNGSSNRESWIFWFMVKCGPDMFSCGF